MKFILDVLLLFRPGIIRPAGGYKNLNAYGMYKNYLKIGWRNLLRNKGYSFINIGGLALGMTVAMLIGLWIYDELSYNKYHENYEDIAIVYRDQQARHEPTIVHPTGLGTLLKTEYGANLASGKCWAHP